MSIITELGAMALKLAARVPMPKIAGVFLPPCCADGQPNGAEFMVMALEGGAGGVSYLLLPQRCADGYRALDPQALVGTRPEQYAEALDGSDPVMNMLGLAAVNAMCQQAMRCFAWAPDPAADSLGSMHVADGDRVGMVGFFPPLLKYLRGSQAELVIVEKDARLVERYPQLNVTLEVAALHNCNKVLCTSATLLNDTLDEVLQHCRHAEHIAVVGPTAGYFPDPLFARGVHVLGGRYVNDGMLLLKHVTAGKEWGAATQKLCFQASRYPGLDALAG